MKLTSPYSNFQLVCVQILYVRSDVFVDHFNEDGLENHDELVKNKEYDDSNSIQTGKAISERGIIVRAMTRSVKGPDSPLIFLRIRIQTNLKGSIYKLGQNTEIIADKM